MLTRRLFSSKVLLMLGCDGGALDIYEEGVCFLRNVGKQPGIECNIPRNDGAVLTTNLLDHEGLTAMESLPVNAVPLKLGRITGKPAGKILQTTKSPA